MRVIIHGITGKMGQMIKSLADANFAGSEFAAGVSPDVTVEGNGLYKSFDKCTEEADVVVDFSFHTAVKGLLDFCVSRKLPVVIGTTAHTPEEKELIKEASKKIPVFATGNMSVGVAVLADLAKKTAAAFPARTSRSSRSTTTRKSMSRAVRP